MDEGARNVRPLNSLNELETLRACALFPTSDLCHVIDVLLLPAHTR